MVDIDYIMELIDSNNSEEKQKQGIELAKDVKCINVFIQPCCPAFNKNVWENCAVILSDRTNDELYPYLYELMLWLRDLNWPGAFCILDRLKQMTNESLFRYVYERCLQCAEAMDEKVWAENLALIKKKI